MAKDNRISMRLDDKTMELLNACEGNSISEKFENLVRDSCDALPKVRKQCELELIRRDKLREQCREVSCMLSDLNQLKMYQNHMMGTYQEYLKSMEKLATAAEAVTKKL